MRKSNYLRMSLALLPHYPAPSGSGAEVRDDTKFG